MRFKKKYQSKLRVKQKNEPEIKKKNTLIFLTHILPGPGISDTTNFCNMNA